MCLPHHQLVLRWNGTTHGLTNGIRAKVMGCSRSDKNFKFKYLIDNITINLWSSWNFANMEDIIRTRNSTFRFSKFTSNKMIFTEFGGFLFKLVRTEIFFLPRGITWQCAHIDASKKKKEYLSFDPNGDSQFLNTVIWCPWRIKKIIFKIVEFWKI